MEPKVLDNDTISIISAPVTPSKIREVEKFNDNSVYAGVESNEDIYDSIYSNFSYAGGEFRPFPSVNVERDEKYSVDNTPSEIRAFVVAFVSNSTGNETGICYARRMFAEIQNRTDNDQRIAYGLMSMTNGLQEVNLE